MKKKYLFIMVLLLQAINFNGQQFVNQDFEQWNSETYYSPSDFYTSLQGFGSESVERSTDAYSGSYSIKLITQDLVFDGENVFGYFANNDPENGELVVPFTSQVDSIVGYYKANLMPGNLAKFHVVFENSGQTILEGNKDFTNIDNTNTWTKFTINTQFPSGIFPDKIGVWAASSHYDGQIIPNSWIQFDNIKFYYNGNEIQAIQNNDFENWDEIVIDEPIGYVSTLIFDVGENPPPIQKITSSTSGNYAIQLNHTPMLYGLDMISFVTNGEDNLDVWPPQGGLSLTTAPDQISFDVNYIQVSNDPNDSAEIYFIFKNNENIIAGYSHFLDHSTNGFQQVNIPVQISQTIDKLVFVATNGEEIGDTLQLDNIVLHYNTGRTENLSVEQLVAFPNPVYNQLNFKIIAQKPEEININIFDLKGKLIQTKKYNLTQGENKLTFKLNFTAKGNYLYQIQTHSGSFSKSFIKK